MEGHTTVKRKYILELYFVLIKADNRKHKQKKWNCY